VEPNAPLFSYEDYFGNRVHAFSVNAAHQTLAIRTRMTVVTKSASELGALSDIPQEQQWAWLAGDEAQDRFLEYLLPTGYTGITPEVSEFAEINGPGGERSGAQSVHQWLSAMSARIRTEFVYDPQATDVHTVAGDLVRRRRGVCQDFAHLMIAACRANGIPARYVSGYHFVGDLQGGNADFEQASHAWVEAYVPGFGWRGYDPTNDAPVGERYVKLGHGRDYKDIVPVKGVYRGTGDASLEVAVDVKKIEG
jgi:transglutaminase-like putative cysteine protease